MEHTLKVGDTIPYYRDGDPQPHPAIVTWINPDGTYQCTWSQWTAKATYSDGALHGTPPGPPD